MKWPWMMWHCLLQLTDSFARSPSLSFQMGKENILWLRGTAVLRPSFFYGTKRREKKLVQPICLPCLRRKGRSSICCLYPCIEIEKIYGSILDFDILTVRS